ncbi:hypothetical protein PFISCL1PPCAC_14692, partial [Pristionchus fissidentatus]
DEFIRMSNCEICDVKFEHRLELVEHQASLSHHIRVEGKLKKGEKRLCPICNFSCIDLSEYSKHVDTDSHVIKLRALRSKRIAIMDSCIPNKKGSRWDSPAYHLPNTSVPPPFIPHNNHFNSFFRPSVHNERQPLLGGQPWNQMSRDEEEYWRICQMQQPGPSRPHQNQQMERRGGMNGNGGPSPDKRGGEGGGQKKKKGGGMISKVLSAAAIVKKKKEEKMSPKTPKKMKEISLTPKVTGMDNKNKRYESLALKGMVTHNKSRTQTMLMERQVKYSLVTGEGATVEGGVNATPQSLPDVTAPILYPFSPPLALPPPSIDVSFAPSTTSDSTYAFCHPVHSTPHNLQNSNWPEFVRGIEALHEDTPATSSMCPPPKQQGGSDEYMKLAKKEFSTRRIKEEVKDEMEEEGGEGGEYSGESKGHDTINMDTLTKNISEKDAKWKTDYAEHKRKISALSSRRDEMRRRFEEEMRKIDEEERRERDKMTELESERASFQNDLQKFRQSHGL